MPFNIESHEWFQLNKTCLVCAQTKLLYDFDARIRYNDGIERVEIVLKKDMMDWLGDYLGQKIKEFRYELKTPPPSNEPYATFITDKTLEMIEGEAYAHMLIDAGVPVTAVRYFGTTHDFVMQNALADTPAVRGAISQASEALKKALSD